MFADTITRHCRTTVRSHCSVPQLKNDIDETLNAAGFVGGTDVFALLGLRSGVSP
jgi:hypothetical protein